MNIKMVQEGLMCKPDVVGSNPTRVIVIYANNLNSFIYPFSSQAPFSTMSSWRKLMSYFMFDLLAFKGS